MTLEDLRKKAAFQNTIDVWIASRAEKDADWYDADGYRRFVRHLRDGGVGLKGYSLCVSDAESPVEHERRKARFAEELGQNGDPDSATYAVRLSDSAIGIVRGFA